MNGKVGFPLSPQNGTRPNHHVLHEIVLQRFQEFGTKTAEIDDA
jgi:hypothetical protein